METENAKDNVGISVSRILDALIHNDDREAPLSYIDERLHYNPLRGLGAEKMINSFTGDIEVLDQRFTDWRNASYKEGDQVPVIVNEFEKLIKEKKGKNIQ